MAHILAFVRGHAIATYFVVTIAISWGGVVAIGGLRGMTGDARQSDPQFPLLVMAMLAGPPIAGFVLTAIVSGGDGFRDLLARLVLWRVAARWYAVALLTAPLVFVAVHALLSLVSPSFIPTLLAAPDPVAVLLPGIAGGLAVGVCEELGWTGFAAPALRARHSAVATAHRRRVVGRPDLPDAGARPPRYAGRPPAAAWPGRGHAGPRLGPPGRGARP
jgi:membrane protease YdiL (CAAX protease family)